MKTDLSGATMRAAETERPKSAFNEHGFKKTIAMLLEEVATLYQEDRIPWVIGYSGGKDSTATLQLVWLALSQLPKEVLTKKVYVISTDTLVENPIVATWVNQSLTTMSEAAATSGLPLTAHKLTPNPTNTFWVNLIGRGYPAPRPKFRWCTERLKINPSNEFIQSIVRENGEAIVVLGTRRAESAARARVMTRLEGKRIRDNLNPNTRLANSYVYSPIEHWSNDDVWMFLMQVKNPWGFNNKDLLTLYQGASADGECPLVIDSTTPSCGDSRFGCWVCTLVEKDKSMQAMIINDSAKDWMLPLLELRNELDVPDDRHLRDFRRMSGNVQLFNDKPVPGPYRQDVREAWLRKLLTAQCHVRKNGPPEMRDLALITQEELREIRRLWVVEKHELEDSLPRIYEEVVGEPYAGGRIDDGLVVSAEEIALLRETCDGDELHFQLARELISIERRHRVMARRSGVFKELEKALKKGFYDNAEDAAQRAREWDAAKNPKAPEPPRPQALSLFDRAEEQGEPGGPLS